MIGIYTDYLEDTERTLRLIAATGNDSLGIIETQADMIEIHRECVEAFER